MGINDLIEVHRLNGMRGFSECKMRLLSCAEMWCKSLCQCHKGSFYIWTFSKAAHSFVLQICMLLL